MSGWVQREAEIAAERANACDDAADAYDRLVAAVWEAVTVDTHEGPASVDVLLNAVRGLREERDALRSIVAGRTMPPSNEELAAHDGPWLVVFDHRAGHAARVVSGLDAQQHADRQRELRRAWVWHPFDERSGELVQRAVTDNPSKPLPITSVVSAADGTGDETR